MNKYPLGRDILVSWSLDSQSVNLAGCDFVFEYSAAGGKKAVTDFIIDDNVLTWTFKKEDQHAYGVYGLHLIAYNSGTKVAEFKDKAAFEIIHGTPSEEEQSLAMQSTVETSQEQLEPDEPVEEEVERYVSRSPLHVEKIPLGSNIVVNWKLLSAEDFDFPLDECDLRLFYAAAGSGCQEAEDFELIADSGNKIQWNFAADKQVRFGLYSLFLDIFYRGARIATLVKEDAFSLVHRNAGQAVRIIDFESVVTTFGGALYSDADVINDGYSSVLRGDRTTPAQNKDILQFDEGLWRAVPVSSLTEIINLGTGVAGLRTDLAGLTSRVSDDEDNISSLAQSAAAIDLRVASAEGSIGDLQLSATSLNARIESAEGDIGSLELTAGSLTTRMTSAEGNIGTLEQTAASMQSTIASQAGSISTLQQTATSLSSMVASHSRDISLIDQKADSIQAQVTTHDGKIATLEVSDRGLHTSVSNLAVDVASVGSTLNTYISTTNARLQEMQAAIDNSIETWFYNGVPTLLNQPAVNWDDDEKNNHLGDLYYDKLTGYAYRFMVDTSGSTNVYSWERITDSDVTLALQNAAYAQATADGKLKMFLSGSTPPYSTPEPPYHLGDLWVKSDGTIYKCIVEKTEDQAFATTDWSPSDFAAGAVMKANFDVLATAIIGTVAAYDADGNITSETATQFAQSIDNISFSVAKVGSALLPTGINISDQLITIRSNNFVLAGNSVGSPAALTLTYRDNVPYISASNIDVTGIFSAPIILSSTINLVDASNNVTAGMCGIYDSQAAGHGIAAWYGGAMVDREDLTHYWTAQQIADWQAMTDEQRAASNLAAKTVFRMDGSGYLANGAISWGATGDLHLLDNVYVGPNLDKTLASISTFVTLLSTWFKDDTITIGNTSYRVLRVNMASDPASTTGFQGVVWNGFFMTQGDQIVGSGTPGGGGGGGKSYLHELLDVYGNPGNVKRDPSTWADPSVPEYAQAGDLLKLTNISGEGAMWTAIPQSHIIPDLSSITALIPSQASPSNQLADKAFVNSSIQTATATYQGSYNLVTDLGLTISATQAQIGTALASAISGEDNNDYAFVQIPTADATPTEIARTDRYKYNGTSWVYEYTLNNSGFTAAQWAAINSNITATKVTSYDTIAGYFTNGLLQAAHVGDLSGTYLPLTGGTITGSTYTPLILNTSATSNYIQFQSEGAVVGYVGYVGTVGMFMRAGDSTYISITNGGDLKKNNTDTFYHSGNSNSISTPWKAQSLTCANSGGARIIIGGTAYNSDAGSIEFRSQYDRTYNGARIRSISDGSYCRQALVFEVSNDSADIQGFNEYMRIQKDGKIGIGTTSPSNKLHVIGTSDWTGVFQGTNSRVVVAHNDGYGISVGSKLNSSSYYLLSVSYNQTQLGSGGSSAFYVRADGRVGIGTSSPGYTLDVNGGFRASGTSYFGSSSGCHLWYQYGGRNQIHLASGGSLRIDINDTTKIVDFDSTGMSLNGILSTTGDQTIASDKNKKTNFQDIRVTLDQIADAPAVSFDWKKGGHSFGSIAQYWKPIVPEAVLGKEGDYSLAYSQLDAVLVINLAREVRELREEVKRLRGN